MIRLDVYCIWNHMFGFHKNTTTKKEWTKNRQKNHTKRCYNGRNCYDFLNLNDVNRFAFYFVSFFCFVSADIRFLYFYIICIWMFWQTEKTVDIYLLPEEFYTQQLNCADSSTVHSSSMRKLSVLYHSRSPRNFDQLQRICLNVFNT